MIVYSCRGENPYKQIKGEIIYGKQNLAITTNESKEIFIIDSRI